jgi:hypothetical protein
MQIRDYVLGGKTMNAKEFVELLYTEKNNMLKCTLVIPKILKLA